MVRKTRTLAQKHRYAQQQRVSLPIGLTDLYKVSCVRCGEETVVNAKSEAQFYRYIDSGKSTYCNKCRKELGMRPIYMPRYPERMVKTGGRAKTYPYGSVIDNYNPGPLGGKRF